MKLILISANVQLLSGPLQTMRLAQLELTEEEIAVILSPVTFEETSAEEFLSSSSDETSFETLMPGIFAGIILFSIVGTGFMIVQSSSIEKKDKNMILPLCLLIWWNAYLKKSSRYSYIRRGRPAHLPLMLTVSEIDSMDFFAMYERYIDSPLRSAVWGTCNKVFNYLE